MLHVRGYASLCQCVDECRPPHRLD
jgi:hypothetical protein